MQIYGVHGEYYSQYIVLNTVNDSNSSYYRHHHPKTFNIGNVPNKVQEGGIINHNWLYDSHITYKYNQSYAYGSQFPNERYSDSIGTNTS